MNKAKLSLRIIIFVASITVSFSTPLLFGCRANHQETPPRVKNFFTLKITPRGEEPIEVIEVEGGIIKTQLEGKTMYGFSPSLIDQAAKTVTIKVFLVSRPPDSLTEKNDRLTEVQSLIAENNLVSYADKESRFTIEVLNVQPKIEVPGTPLPEDGSGPSDLNGPVTCRQWETSACAVKTVCGGACDSYCCE